MQLNNPKLTAYILGELTAEEVREVEQAVATSPELRAELDAIRLTTQELTDFLQNEPLPATPLQTADGILPPYPARRAPGKKFYHRTILALCGTAICLTAIIATPYLAKNFPPSDSVSKSPRELAVLSEQTDSKSNFLPAESVKKEADFAGQPLSRDRDSSAAAVSQQSSQQKSSEVSLSSPSSVTSAVKGDSAPGQVAASGTSAVRGGGRPASGGQQRGGIGGISAADSSGADSRGRLSMAFSSSPPPPSAAYNAPKGLPSSTAAPMERGFARSDSMMMTSPRMIIQEEEEIRLGLIARDPYDKERTAKFSQFTEQTFQQPKDQPFSTFSIDVDTASYSTMRRYLTELGQLPPKESVRVEEFVNYFKYNYAPPTNKPIAADTDSDTDSDGVTPFAVHVDVAECPWTTSHLLARIGIKGRELSKENRPPVHLTFLIDSSGSMSGPKRLPLVQQALVELTEQLQDSDRVAIVTYAGSSRIVLPSVSAREKKAILESIAELTAGGSTAGASGIKMAYEVARKSFSTADGAQNRVVLCTDGDFNVGTTDNKTLEEMIGDEAKSGVFLTILGFGMGNFQDDRLEILSNRGNGNYGYIDSIDEARKLLVHGLTGTLFTIAKDVKIQVDFNPEQVAAYRLIGFDNRLLAAEDFHNDKKDAGEIGAGHTMTALYEIVPVGVEIPSMPRVDTSRYSTTTANETDKKDESVVEKPTDKTVSAASGELMFVKLRYKQPTATKSTLLEYPVSWNREKAASVEDSSSDFDFAAAVALFGMILRGSDYYGDGTFGMVQRLSQRGVDSSEDETDRKYRKEFLELVELASKK